MRRAWPVLALLLAGPAWAQEARIGLRAGEHPGRSRLVLDWPQRPDYRVEQNGERLLLRLPPALAPGLEAGGRLARNLQAMARVPEGLLLTLRPGVRVRHFVIDHRLVLDLSDPASEPEPPRPRRPAAAVAAARLAQPAPPAAAPAPTRPAAVADVPSTVAPASAQPLRLPPVLPLAAPAVAEPAAVPLPREEVVQAPLPPPAPPAVLAPAAAVQARVLAAQGQPPALHLPFNEPTGAALLRRGEVLLLAFASAQPLDLAGLRGTPLFAALEVTSLPGGVVLQLPLAAPAGVRARREGPGWVLHFTRGDESRDSTAEPRALAPEAQPPRLVLPAARPGPVLRLADPETGLPLLLGTVQEAAQLVALPRRLAEFELPPTLLGLAVLARADSITLVPQHDRFVIAAAGGAELSLDPAAAAPGNGAPAMTRSFDLPAAAVPALFNRLRAQQGGIAAAAPLARAPVRRDAAETLLALGLGAEAQAMAGLAMAEDPAAAADPRSIGLAAAGAVLAGRVADARPLRDAGLPATDEATLWQAALAALEQQPERAAPGFAATLPLLLDYPAPLRARLLPLAAEALAEAGETSALARLLAAEPEGLALPRALLLQAQGKPAEAQAALQAIAAGADRRARALALRRAIDMRLESGALEPAAAARALEATLFAWRGDAVELATRRRLAALRLLARQPREALELLQETAALFPEQAAALRPALGDALLAALRDEPPLAAVALHDANAELLQGEARADAAALLLAERLLALDLTERAAALLARAADRATEPPRRAALGLRLAGLLLEEGNAAAALAALESTKGEALPEALSRQRVVLAARAEARRGNLAQAVAGLQEMGEAGAAPLSELLAEAQDWPAAAAAGAQALAALPAAPAPLDSAQHRLLLRQAALLALAGDEAGLAALRAQAPRLPAGPLAEGFAALTAESLKGLADLPRLAREQQLFRNLPGRLEALRAGAPVTR